MTHYPLSPMVSNKKAIAYCQDVIDLYGLDLDLYAQADQLNQASQRLVQLVHTLICKPRVLILDEFSSFLNSRQTQLIFRILEILKAQNTLIVIITHKYSEICKYCDGVSVITDGTVSASFHKADFDSDQFITQIADLNMDFQYPKLKVETGSELIHITTTRHLPLEDLDFKLHKREIIGITGLSSQEKRLPFFCCPPITPSWSACAAVLSSSRTESKLVAMQLTTYPVMFYTKNYSVFHLERILIWNRTN